MAVKQKQKQRTFTRSQIKWRIFGIVILVIICAVIAVPATANRGINWLNKKSNIGIPRFPERGFNLGLDLQGGAHLLYQADTSKIPGGDQAGSVEGVRDVIERRVRGGLGVSEPLVQTTKVGQDYRIIVELPGVTNVNDAIKQIGETPVLEFREENHEPTRELTTVEMKQLNDFNAAANQHAQLAIAALRKGTDFAVVVAQYSEEAKTKNSGGDMGFVSEDVLPEIYAWAKAHKPGDVGFTPVTTTEGAHILKRFGERAGEKQLQVSQILICYQGAEGCESTLTQSQAKAKIDELKKQATAQNFADLATKNSMWPGADKTGGDLGTIKKGQTPAEFESAIWNALVGSVVGPVETALGYHLLYKTGETTPAEYQVAHIFFKYKLKTDIVPAAEAWKPTGLSGKQLKKAEVAEDSRNGQIQVALQFDSEGAKLFGDITTRNVGKQIAIFLDGQPVGNPPRVNEAILTGSAVISGNFSISEARLMVQRLNSGALPVPIELISQKKVDATLGAGSLQKSFAAGLWGLFAVMIFMILFYRLPGFLSVISLTVYAFLNLAIFKVIGVTLTLAGIAGFILSIGMAVDANVLVFERLKEELRAGKGLRSATEESFLRAWPSIRDGHVTGLISCVLLIWFGSGFIQGFAVILAVGTLVSLFTAITVTRIIMRFVFGFFSDNGSWLFLGHPDSARAESRIRDFPVKENRDRR